MRGKPEYCQGSLALIPPPFLLPSFAFFFLTEEGELRRTLQSLACGKARVLVKKPKVHLHLEHNFRASFAEGSKGGWDCDA